MPTRSKRKDPDTKMRNSTENTQNAGVAKLVPKVKCELCGRSFFRLTETHLRAYHNISRAEYIEKYGEMSVRPQLDGKPVMWMPGGPHNSRLEDPETYAEIMALARRGYPKSTVAAMVGLAPATLYNWLNYGDPANVDKYGNYLSEEKYYKFRQDYERAEAMSEITAIDHLLDAGSTEWRAAVEFLQRRFPENWRLESKKIIEAEGEVTHRHISDVDVDKLLEDPELADMACQLLERISEGDRVIDAGPGDFEEDS